MPQSLDSLYRALLQVNNILVREVTPEGLFRCLATSLKQMVNCDRLSLTIYDAETDTLDWFARAEGVAVTRMDSADSPVRGPLARLAIESGQPVIAPQLEAFADHEAVQLMLAAGLRSAMSFPLISQGKAIGAVVVSFLHYIDDEERISQSTLLKEVCGQVALAVHNMLIHAKLNQRNEYLSQQVDSLLSADDGLHMGSRFFYNCATMQNLMSQIRLLARSDAPVLICGETGTGKEFVARFIHRYSQRAKHNFVKVSCPALSPTLFESELFGHAKGAFTGASCRRLGRFELADKGSVFLDEIGDLDIVLQAKLLHVLQDSKFERVGESRPISVDARCISATNADLHHMMFEGKFRRDLFYRMGVTTVQIPPLREREGEILPMLHYLMKMYAADMQRSPLHFHSDALKMLEDYHWPGNVRELSNLLARLLILHPGAQIGPEHILPLLEQGASLAKAAATPQARVAAEGPQCLERQPPEHQFFERQAPEHPAAVRPPFEHSAPQHSAYDEQALAQVEKLHIERILRLTNGRVSGRHGAAALLNIPRSTLQYKLKKHGIKPRDFNGIDER